MNTALASQFVERYGPFRLAAGLRAWCDETSSFTGRERQVTDL